MQHEFTEEELRTMQIMSPLMKSLLMFINEASQAETPRMTKIMLDTDTVLLHIWASHKYNSVFKRIESLVATLDQHKELLLKAAEIVEATDKDANFELLTDIRHALNEF